MPSITIHRSGKYKQGIWVNSKLLSELMLDPLQSGSGDYGFKSAPYFHAQVSLSPWVLTPSLAEPKFCQMSAPVLASFSSFDTAALHMPLTFHLDREICCYTRPFLM